MLEKKTYTNSELKELYSVYLRQIVKSRNYVAKFSGTTRKLKAHEFTEFVSDFKGVKGDNPRMSGKRVAELMAKQETYLASTSQSKNFAKAYIEHVWEPTKTEPTPPSIGKLEMEFRMGKKTRHEALWEYVKKVKDEKKAEIAAIQKKNPNYKFNTVNMNQYIGHEVIGSP